MKSYKNRTSFSALQLRPSQNTAYLSCPKLQILHTQIWVFHEVSTFEITALLQSIFYPWLSPILPNDCSLSILAIFWKGKLTLGSLRTAPFHMEFYHTSDSDHWAALSFCFLLAYWKHWFVVSRKTTCAQQLFLFCFSELLTKISLLQRLNCCLLDAAALFSFCFTSFYSSVLSKQIRNSGLWGHPFVNYSLHYVWRKKTILLCSNCLKFPQPNLLLYQNA